MIDVTTGAWMIVVGLVLGVCAWASLDYYEQPVLRRARRMQQRKEGAK
jgi:peptidoglycan/LPS O-acetylase OafA/YrhL